jgi:hypothetical protein
MSPMPLTQHLVARKDVLLISLLMGGLFCALHLLNGWVFQFVAFSQHISLIYLPGFLRLANVLILGLVWGTAATAFGGLLLAGFWSNESLFLSLCNLCVSATSALLAVLLMRALQGRKIALSRLMDLLQLALLYALLNALVHHLLWTYLDPSQLIAPVQLLYMVVGDINGAVIGALVLRWVARKTRLIQAVRARSRNAVSSD